MKPNFPPLGVVENKKDLGALQMENTHLRENLEALAKAYEALSEKTIKTLEHSLDIIQRGQVWEGTLVLTDFLNEVSPPEDPEPLVG